MSIFEWLFERKNPHPVGEMSGFDNQRTRSKLSCIVTGIIAIGAIISVPILYMTRVEEPDWGIAAVIFIGECLYITIGYKIKSSPNYDNVGWAGGMFDNPFRYTDDLNRMLLFFKVVLMPGRVLGIGVVDFVRAIISSEENTS